MLAMLYIANSQLVKMEKQVEIIVTDRLAKVVDTEQMIKNTLDMGWQVRNLILLDLPEERALAKEKVAELWSSNGAVLERLDKTLTSETSRGILKRILDSRVVLSQFYVRIFELAETDRIAARKLVLGEFIKSNDQFITDLNALSNYEKGKMAEQRDEAHQTDSTARNTVLGIAGFAFLSSCLVAYLIIVSINTPLKGFKTRC